MKKKKVRKKKWQREASRFEILNEKLTKFSLLLLLSVFCMCVASLMYFQEGVVHMTRGRDIDPSMAKFLSFPFGLGGLLSLLFSLLQIKGMVLKNEYLDKDTEELLPNFKNVSFLVLLTVVCLSLSYGLLWFTNAELSLL